ncbi:pheromone A receptor-domain-containing protein [Mycena leptocephala]|nr:pheromone A receptor-domain-containing protein [Mycena leptocephala]
MTCEGSSTSSSVRTVTKTYAEKHRVILIDLAIGLGIPPLQIPLRASLYRSPSNPNPELDAHAEYIVQGHRYNIFEDIGCLGETYETPSPSQHKTFYRSRSQFRLLLSASAHANLNLNRHLRLMALAATDVLLTVPLASFVLYPNVAITGLSPWISWADTHSNFSQVVQVPGIYWRADPYSAASVEMLRWAVACALLLFAYFGFADEAVKNSRGAFYSVARRVGYTSAGSASGLGSTGATSKFPLFLAWSYPPRLHPQRNHPKAGIVRLFPQYVRVLRRDLNARVRRREDVALGEYNEGTGVEKLTLGDVSGILPDHKVSDYSSSPSSDSASSVSSVHGEKEEGKEEAEIAVSSLHCASVHIPVPPRR